MWKSKKLCWPRWQPPHQLLGHRVGLPRHSAFGHRRFAYARTSRSWLEWFLLAVQDCRLFDFNGRGFAHARKARAIVVTETQLVSEHDGSIAMDQYAIRQMPSNTPCKCEPLTIATESHEILRCVEVLYADYLLIDDRPGI
jgi:hypothetical protein